MTPEQATEIDDLNRERAGRMNDVAALRREEDSLNALGRGLGFAAAAAGLLIGGAAFFAQKTAARKSVAGRPIADRVGQIDNRIAQIKDQLNAAGIASAQADAADATRRASDADLKRAELERQIAPRRLTAEQQRGISFACPALYGKPVIVLSYMLDAEGAALAEQIVAALRATRLTVVSRVGGVSVTGSPDTAVAVRGPVSASAFTFCLGRALKEIGHLNVSVNGSAKRDPLTAMEGMFNLNLGEAPSFPAQPLPEGAPVMVFVGVKPIALVSPI